MIFVDDPDFQLHVGDALDVLRGMPDESVHCVVTSPPYWGLRDYQTGSWDGGDPDCDHLVRENPRVESSTLGGGKATTGHQREGFKDKCGHCGATRTDQQLGLEPTPDTYIQRMVEVFREVRRVLRRDGTCWLNIGDSYNNRAKTRETSHQPALNDFEDDNWAERAARGGVRMSIVDGQIKEKDLVGIPWRLAFALQADGWYLRADIIWSKPNPMPESVTDRPTKAHEYVFLLSREARYFYDAENIREEIKPGNTGVASVVEKTGGTAFEENGKPKAALRSYDVIKGANARSVWTIATQPYAEAHFATFPEELPRRCIAAGTSERGCCPVCGAPWEREVTRSPNNDGYANGPGGDQRNRIPGQPAHRGSLSDVARWDSVTIGWRPTCDHYQKHDGLDAAENWPLTIVPCTVLDPFMGSGTVALVARRLGRKSIGIELNPEYAELCARRLQQQSLFACVVDESGGMKDTIG